MRLRLKRRPLWISSRIAAAVVPPRRQDDDRAAPPITRQTALLIGGACYVAIVTSHQLSPVMLILSVFVLSVVTRKVPLWVPVVMGGLEVWWVALGWTFLQAHFSLIDTGGAGAAAAGRNLSMALPNAALSFYAPAAVMLLMAALAGVGFVRRLRRGKWDLVPACLILAPVSVALLQSYGARAAIGRTCLRFRGCRSWPYSRARLGGRRRAGREYSAAVCWWPRRPWPHACCAPSSGRSWPTVCRPVTSKRRWGTSTCSRLGSMRIDLAPNAPDRLTARYPLVDLSDLPALVSQARFAGHRLGAADVTRLIRLIESSELGRHTSFCRACRRTMHGSKGCCPRGRSHAS